MNLKNAVAVSEKLEANLTSSQPLQQQHAHYNGASQSNEKTMIEKNVITNNHNLNEDDEIIEKNDIIMASPVQHNGHHKSSLSNQQHEVMIHQDESSQTSITKHSLLQFAMQHFRNE